jgi:hypothetical protein
LDPKKLVAQSVNHPKTTFPLCTWVAQGLLPFLTFGHQTQSMPCVLCPPCALFHRLGLCFTILWNNAEGRLWSSTGLDLFSTVYSV